MLEEEVDDVLETVDEVELVLEVVDEVLAVLDVVVDELEVVLVVLISPLSLKTIPVTSGPGAAIEDAIADVTPTCS